MRTDTSSNYTYPLITPLYLKGCHRCDQAKNLDIMEKKRNFFSELGTNEIEGDKDF